MKHRLAPLILLLAVAGIYAQTAAFEVASVKQGTFTPPSFPLDMSDAFVPTGSRFHANFPLLTYVLFAYKINPAPDQRQAIVAHLPGWVSTDRFTIEAKAESNSPTKDQFRLMMRSLLADRFKLAVHFETQQGSIFALTLAKPGKLGPKLRPHGDGPPCDASAGTDVFPAMCDAYAMETTPDRMHVRNGSRNTTMALFAANLPGISGLSIPVVDQTGLSGRYDFAIEWSPQPSDPFATILALQPDPEGLTYLDAMRDQLGLKLESAKGPIQVLVIDHVERPSEN
jgi:bla regulator protein BlaR1